MAKRTSPQPTLRIARTFAAPREKVFQAWTEPERLTQWLCRVTEKHSVKLLELDLRVGGRYRLEGRSPEGNRYLLSGTYLEIRPPEKLVFTWSWEGDPDFGESLVTVELRALGDSTELVLTHERFPNLKARDQHETGWNGCFEQLAKAL